MPAAHAQPAFSAQGKKKGKGKKGGKGKKAKALPGAKACANMDVDHMLSVLVENKIVNNVRPRTVAELRGTFNYLGSAYQVRRAAGEGGGGVGDDHCAPS